MSEGQFSGYDNWYAGRTIATSAGFLLPHLRPGMTLLDCGCGPGSITLDFAEVLAPGEVVGVDIEEASLERGRNGAKERGLNNVRFEAGSIYELPFPDASFDAVWASSVLQWLEQPRQALREMERVLKPGGVLGTRDRCGRTDVFGNANRLVLRGRRLHYRLVASWGFRARMGEELHDILLRDGLEDVKTGATFESRSDQAGARFMAGLYRAHLERPGTAAEICKRGWSTSEELTEIVEAWKTWGEDPRSYYAMARLETVARKAG